MPNQSQPSLLPLRTLRSDADYQSALDFKELLWESPVGSEEELELERVLALIDDYERKHYPIAVPVRGYDNEMKYRLVTRANGRDILPVRGFSYLEGWALTPYAVAEAMARKDDPEKNIEYQSLLAYRFENERFTRVTTAEWESILESLDAHKKDLAKAVRGREKQLALLKEEAILLLPAGCFFFVDEFIDAFCEEVDEYGPEFTDPVKARHELVSRPISDDEAKVIFEGLEFPSVQRSRPKDAVAVGERADVALREKIIELASIYLQQWRAAEFEPTKQDVALYLEGELSSQGLTGTRGKFLDRGYIERHYLTGITGRSPGYKLKKPRIPNGQRGELPTFK